MELQEATGFLLQQRFGTHSRGDAGSWVQQRSSVQHGARWGYSLMKSPSAFPQSAPISSQLHLEEHLLSLFSARTDSEDSARPSMRDWNRKGWSKGSWSYVAYVEVLVVREQPEQSREHHKLSFATIFILKRSVDAEGSRLQSTAHVLWQGQHVPQETHRIKQVLWGPQQPCGPP